MALKIEKEKAKRLFPEVPDWFKEELQKEFGKDAFKKRNFSDIKTFEDACTELELTQKDLLNIGNNDKPDEVAYKKLKIIISAINHGWIPDWNNTNQCKWFPWFNLSSGFGFSCSYYHFGYAGTGVGSRLCFETEEKANYAGEQFLELYKDFLTL
jgi:hypothetical protein